MLDLVQKTVTDEEDEYSVTGKRVAFQLSGMSEEQKLIAEKIISDVMFHCRMGKLTVDTTLHIPAKDPFPTLGNRHPYSAQQSSQLLSQMQHQHLSRPTHSKSHDTAMPDENVQASLSQYFRFE